MNENIYEAPNASLDNSDDKTCDVALWNPDVAGAWSLLFTPIFGSTIVYKNWKALGDEEQAKKAKKWIYISIPMAILSVILGVLGFIYIVIWYFSSQKNQTRYLKSTYQGVYPKKGWLKPLGFALLVWVCSVFLIISLFAGLGSA